MLYWSPHNLELEEDPSSLNGGDEEGDMSDSEAAVDGQTEKTGEEDEAAEMQEESDEDEELGRKRGSPMPQHTGDGRKVWQEHEVCRMAKLLKSPSNQPRVISFEIHPMGVRDRGFARKHRKLQRRLERMKKQRQAQHRTRKPSPRDDRSGPVDDEEEMKECSSSSTTIQQQQQHQEQLVGQKRRWKDEYDDEFL